MIAVTIDEAWPGFGGPFTVADLDRMPSDGHRYELMDGVLVVSPGRPPCTSSWLGDCMGFSAQYARRTSA
jgi:hypothetical protein